MKKFFLIPVMALFVCVNAWGGINYPLMEIAPDGSLVEAVKPAAAPIKRVVMDDPEPTYVAQIGAVQYESLEAAFEAAVDNDVIELLADWSSGAWCAGEIDNKSLTIRGNGFSIKGCLIVANETSSPITITYDGVTISSSSWEMYVVGDVTINLANGSSNSMTSSKSYGIYGYGNAGNLTISGNGSLNSSAAYQFYQMGSLRVDAPNLTVSTTSSSFAYLSNNVVLNAGTYGADPSLYVDFTSHVVTKPSTSYIVSTPAADVVAYNQSTKTTYTSLADAVEAAANGQVIYVYKNDATAISVAKNITIKTNGYTTNLSAGTGYSRADVGSNIMFTDNAIAAFLMADGTNSMTIGANADISAAGAIHVNGDKTLTINSGVTVTYKRQGDYANIIVDNGAKLTVLGSGTFQPVGGTAIETSATATNQVGNRAIDVDGELVIGVKNDANNQPHFITTSIARGGAFTANAGCTVTINNVDIQAACACFFNDGNITINGGEFKSIATAQNGIDNKNFYSYALRNDAGSHLTINGGHFVGTHGCVAVYAKAIADINGGQFETVYGHNYATDADNTADNHYALYVAREAIVNVYGGDFKVQTPNAGSNNVVLSGNDDAYNTYGVINIYGGRYQKKAQVSPKKNGESAYPASIPSTSQWYSCFGSEAPLPAGYEYYETGDATYPWGVRVIPGTETAEVEVPADPTATIPWQQNTTWDATADPGSDQVPEENTIVTIPVDATVVVSNSETDKEAEAKQIFISQGAELVVETGTTLTIGDGGVNIGNGGQLTIEPGAIIKIGSAGIITTEETALVVETSEETPSVLLYAPTVEENTQPQATYRFTSKARHQTSPNKWVWQRFGIPSSDGSTTMSWTPGIRTVLEEFNYSTNSWNKIYDGNDGTFVSNATRNFQCYIMTTDAPDAGTIYDFSGNLMGNQNASFDFVKGWNYYANSYTAPISIKEMLNDVLGTYGSTVSATAYIYRAEDNWWDEVNLGIIGLAELGLRAPVPTEINPMQAFILYLYNGNTESGEIINYEDHIYNPIMGITTTAPARNKATNSGFDGVVVMSITDGTYTDMMSLIEDASFSAAFDNGYDSHKYMNTSAFNMYASSNNEKFGMLATDNLSGTLMDFNAATDGQYTITFTGVMGKQYVLRDLYTNVSVNIVKDGTYSFSAQAGDNESRFMLVGPSNMPTELETVEQEAVKASGIYSITGQYLGETSILTTLPKGVYVVDGVKVVK